MLYEAVDRNTAEDSYPTKDDFAKDQNKMVESEIVKKIAEDVEKERQEEESLEDLARETKAKGIDEIKKQWENLVDEEVERKIAKDEKKRARWEQI